MNAGYQASPGTPSVVETKRLINSAVSIRTDDQRDQGAAGGFCTVSAQQAPGGTDCEPAASLLLGAGQGLPRPPSARPAPTKMALSRTFTASAHSAQRPRRDLGLHVRPPHTPHSRPRCPRPLAPPGGLTVSSRPWGGVWSGHPRTQPSMAGGCTDILILIPDGRLSPDSEHRGQ